MSEAELQVEPILELERQLRVKHSRVHNVFSAIFHPHRLIEEALRRDLELRFGQIIRHNDAESALRIANELSLGELKEAHSKVYEHKVDMTEVEKAHSRLVPTYTEVIYPKMIIAGSLEPRDILGYFPAPKIVYQASKENGEAALQVIRTLLEVTR